MNRKEQARRFWNVLTHEEQNEYATLTLDYWYLSKHPKKRARVAEIEALAKERIKELDDAE